jgi:hypothetical protein
MSYRLIRLRSAVYALEANGRVIATVDRKLDRGYWTAELLGYEAPDSRPKPFEGRSHRFSTFASAREWLGWPEIVEPEKEDFPIRWRRRRPSAASGGGNCATQDSRERRLSSLERLLRAWDKASAADRQRFLDTAGLRWSEPSSTDNIDKPLTKVRHEAFAQGVAAGLSASRAYALAYGRRADGATRASAARLLANTSVQTRIDEIQRHGEALALRSLLDLVPVLERHIRAASQEGKFAEAVSALKQIARIAATR